MTSLLPVVFVFHFLAWDAFRLNMNFFFLSAFICFTLLCSHFEQFWFAKDNNKFVVAVIAIAVVLQKKQGQCAF